MRIGIKKIFRLFQNSLFTILHFKRKEKLVIFGEMK